MVTQSPAEVTINSAEDVERVFLRLVVADTDAKLQRFTNLHLCDILEFLGKNSGCTNQIVELLTHYNKVVKNNTAIDFPVDKLLSLFEGNSLVVSNFSLIYLKYARDRVSAEKQVELVPIYLAALSKKPHDLSFAYEIVGLCFPGLSQLSKIEKQKWPVSINLSDTDQLVISKIFLSILSFRAVNLAEVQNKVKDMTTTNISCPGMSPEQYQLVANKIIGNQLHLTEDMLTIVKLLTQGILNEKITFPLLVVASAANINLIDDAAESAIKKIEIQSTVDDANVVKTLMATYLGSAAEVTKPAGFNITIQPANNLVKHKILTFLTRSQTAPTTYMNNMKICLDGISSDFIKIRTSSLIFLNTVIEKMPQTALKALGANIFGKLKNLVRPATTNSAALCLVYRCLGTLGKVQPSLIFQDISIVDTLLSTIPQEEEDVAYSIVDCLVAWLPVFLNSTTNQDVSANLKKYISDHVTHENTKCRMVSLKYIETLIDENEMDLKWMLLRASGDAREEMRQEAIRLLELSLKKTLPSIPLVIETFWEHLGNGIQNPAQSNPYNKMVYQMCSMYLWAVAETTVTKKPADLRIVEGDDHWVTVAPLVFELISDLSTDVFNKCIEILNHAVLESSDAHIFRIATCFLTAFYSSQNVPANLKNPSRFENKFTACRDRCRVSTRLELLRAVGDFLSVLSADNITIRTEMASVSKNDLVQKRIPGNAWSWVGSLVSPLWDNNQQIVGESISCVDTLVDFVKDGYERPSSLLDSSLGALSFLLQNNTDTVAGLSSEKSTEISELCEKIAASRKDTISQRARESAVRILGFLVLETSDEDYQKTAKYLFAVGEGPPQPELQLTVGEALIDAMCGKYSLSRRNYYSTKEEERKLSKITDEGVKNRLQERIKNYLMNEVQQKLTSANHHLRRAGLVWLLVAVQRLSKLDAIAFEDRVCLSMIQNAFADGLTENDEFTQDVASKGMGIVYAVAGSDLRKELVSSLMDALSDGRKTERKVDGSTVLFEKGQLGKSPTGDNLTTYKELCSLATDLNQPDLVYKFMQLAKHNATWNAKKGAAFGFGAVLEQSREEMEPYFAHLVPKLFRYRYDPDLKVQASMRSIWSVLTANRRNVVDEFADEIAKELNPSLINKEWRVRESACLALSDLLRGHDTPYMHQMIPEYLETVLRVRDDIKESVRLAADKAAEAIRRLVVRLASSTNSAKADAFLATVLPTIVDQGIVNSTVKSNKAYCLLLVLEMSKTARRQMKPFLNKLIPTLLDSISDSESSVLNYLAVRSDSAQLEALDDARAQMAKTSPMMTAIHDLLPHIDSFVLISMTPQVCDQLRASVGVSTRSAAAQLITQLALRAPQLMMDNPPQCDKLFHSLIPGVRDRNPSIRKQFANAMSYLSKYVSSNNMMSLIKTVVADLVTENEELKQSARHVLRNLSANCSELLAGYATQIVPYVFLETCQDVPKGDETARLRQEEWAELWAELVPSTSSAARLYKKEIFSTGIDIVLNNEVWTVRAQAARMIGKAADALGNTIGEETTKSVIDALLPSLSGRIWAGKEEILIALSKVFEAGGEEYKKSLQANDLTEISKVLKREAGKKNIDYASCGMTALARYCVVVEDVESADWLADRVASNIDKCINSGEKKDDDSDDQMEGLTNLEKEIRISKVVTSNLTVLAVSLAAYRNGSTADKAINQLVSHMKNNSIAWKAKQNMFVELIETVQKWQLTSPINASDMVVAIFEQADLLCAQQKKTVAADALQVIIKMQERRAMYSVDWNDVAEKMKNGTAGQVTGLANRLEEQPMELD